MIRLKSGREVEREGFQISINDGGDLRETERGPRTGTGSAREWRGPLTPDERHELAHVMMERWAKWGCACPFVDELNDAVWADKREAEAPRVWTILEPGTPPSDPPPDAVEFHPPTEHMETTPPRVWHLLTPPSETPRHAPIGLPPGAGEFHPVVGTQSGALKVDAPPIHNPDMVKTKGAAPPGWTAHEGVWPAAGIPIVFAGHAVITAQQDGVYEVRDKDGTRTVTAKAGDTLSPQPPAPTKLVVVQEGGGDTCGLCPLCRGEESVEWCSVDDKQRRVNPTELEPIPDWCPLRAGDVVVRMQKREAT